MPRLLIRSGKSPFTAVAPETTLTQDVFNSNSGNFLFQHSVWKSLSIDGADLVSNSTLTERREANRRDAALVNDEFDHFVIPMANSFRPDFIDKLDRLSGFVEQLTIPATVVGIGAQAPVGGGFEALDGIRDQVRRFVRAVLERSASIGVRGEFTRGYLRHLGFPDDAIDVIGCPSLFLHGRDFTVTKKLDRIDADARLALNLTPEVPGIGGFASDQAERHPNLVYIGQDQHDLRLLLWGVRFPHVDDPTVPVHLGHRLYQEDRQLLFVDTWTWYDFLAEHDFVYGTRFHGNVAGLLAGTPSLLLAHDSRTTELAEYHAMPHLVMPSFEARMSAEELYEATDLSAFNDAMPGLFDRYTAFLERNGLAHRWTPGNGTGGFDEQLGAARFPDAVRPLAKADVSQIAARLDWLRHASVIDMTRHPARYEYPFNHPEYRGAGSRHARLAEDRDAKITAQQARIDELSARLERLERRGIGGLWRRAKSRGRRALSR